MIALKLEGIDDLQKAMRAIGKKAAVEASFVAIQHGCLPIVAIAKAKARKKTGALADSITATVKRKKRNAGTFAYIGPASKYRGPDGSRPALYAHLIEKGHAKTGGGTVPAYPFMRPAIDTGAAPAMEQIKETFGTALSIKIDALPEVKKARLKGKKA